MLLPDGTSAHVFNTHTHANWVHSTAPDALYPEVRIPTDSFAPYRTAHIVDAISFMRRTVEAASAAEELVIAGGAGWGWAGLVLGNTKKCGHGWVREMNEQRECGRGAGDRRWGLDGAGQGFPWAIALLPYRAGGVRHGKGPRG